MTRIILIGAGKGGKALVELFHKDPTVEIAGVADKDAGAPGLALARELGLRVSADYREFLRGEEDGLIIDVTGKTRGAGLSGNQGCGRHAARWRERWQRRIRSVHRQIHGVDSAPAPPVHGLQRFGLQCVL
jgi:hypothetical protein